MTLIKYHSDSEGQMIVAGFITGTGSNLVKLIEHEKKLDKLHGKSPYHIAVIFSNSAQSKAPEIGAKFDLPAIIHDLRGFAAARGRKWTNMEIRPEFDAMTVKALLPYEVETVALAGYMARVTDQIIGGYTVTNVHPADLSIKDEHGKRKYVGHNAVEAALRAGGKEIRSSTHIVTEEVDGGPILMVSPPLEIAPLPEAADDRLIKILADAYQDKLKEVGDWEIYPKTLQYIAEGRYAYSNSRNTNLHFDGKPIPNGLRLPGQGTVL